jgi:hypothetical protein
MPFLVNTDGRPGLAYRVVALPDADGSIVLQHKLFQSGFKYNLLFRTVCVCDN